MKTDGQSHSREDDNEVGKCGIYNTGQTWKMTNIQRIKAATYERTLTT